LAHKGFWDGSEDPDKTPFVQKQGSLTQFQSATGQEIHGRQDDLLSFGEIPKLPAEWLAARRQGLDPSGAKEMGIPEEPQP
jgi:hypothetical protein